MRDRAILQYDVRRLVRAADPDNLPIDGAILAKGWKDEGPWPRAPWEGYDDRIVGRNQIPDGAIVGQEVVKRAEGLGHVRGRIRAGRRDQPLTDLIPALLINDTRPLAGAD